MSSFSNNITIVDYGTSNLNSIQRALFKIGATVNTTNDSNEIENADRLILPGVGSFGNGMKKLKNLEVINSMNIFIEKGNPFLGICLGMQMFLTISEENKDEEGLGYINGEVIKIPSEKEKNHFRKIPHIGWSNLDFNKKIKNEEYKIFSNISDNDFFYFVHSYMCMPSNYENVVATCDYHDFKVTAAIQNKNIIGMQFHPEISGKSGLKILNNFLKYY
tara:strand:- start:790 stop:1446 length:657 start_codon:yes stop_codon:yes gene_type:complete